MTCIQALTYFFSTLLKREVWTLEELLRGKQAISGRWVFRTKLKENGIISRYKARFVARGYSQIEGVDFFETLLSGQIQLVFFYRLQLLLTMTSVNLMSRPLLSTASEMWTRLL
jgi:hypothetical protein